MSALENDDAAIVGAVRAGDHQRFAMLVQRYNQALFRVVRGIVRAEADAEDVLQEAHLSAFSHLDQLTDPAAYRGWVSRIAVRGALARVRSQQPLDSLSAEPVVAAATTLDPERALAATSLRAQLESAIDGLDDDQRAVFVMRVVHEASTSETAEALGLSEENVRVRLHRARAALRADLQEAPWPSVHQFDGARCERMANAVMAGLPTLAKPATAP